MADDPVADDPAAEDPADDLGVRLDGLIAESREQATRLRVALLEAVADLAR